MALNDQIKKEKIYDINRKQPKMSLIIRQNSEV